MRFLPPGLVIHRWCPLTDPFTLQPIGQSRDKKMVHLARPETVTAFQQLSHAAAREGIHLHVIWAFRDPALQREQFEEAKVKHGTRNGIRWLAPPGYSEHQTGWVLDIGDIVDPAADDNTLFERTAAFQWLKKNAMSFGFELSFLPRNWQGVSYEPWHWRFVGTLEARKAFHPQGLWALWVYTRSFAQALRWWLHP
jgi:LAS superfamily LD-carboxypeptidase LdcB